MSRAGPPGAPYIFFNSDLDSAAEWRAALATQLEAFTLFTTEDPLDPALADVALVWKLPPGGLDRFVNLRAVLSLGAGINQLNPQELPAHVPLARLVDTSLTGTMIEYAKAAVYRYHRRFHLFERRSRESNWTFIPPTLAGETAVAVLGLGEIGGPIAEALRQEGFRVGGWSRRPRPLDGITQYSGQDGLERLVADSDILINVLPLTGDTRGILNRRLFAHCRAGLCLINMGRGPHLVEADLIEALASGRIDSATLDVAIEEPPPPGHPFWNHPQILLTPHVAGQAVPGTAARNIAANIRRAMAGEPLANVVDLARGY